MRTLYGVLAAVLVFLALAASSASASAHSFCGDDLWAQYYSDVGTLSAVSSALVYDQQLVHDDYLDNVPNALLDYDLANVSTDIQQRDIYTAKVAGDLDALAQCY